MGHGTETLLPNGLTKLHKQYIAWDTCKSDRHKSEHATSGQIVLLHEWYYVYTGCSTLVYNWGPILGQCWLYSFKVHLTSL